MFTIGDFAKLGQVSVRMLRHYDAIGLLRPAAVDPASGYRFYRAEQLGRLNRVIALKDLGFTLQQVQEILDEKVGTDELRGMLRLRLAQLEAQLAADASRLARVAARLRTIESEGYMSTEDVVVKPVEPMRVAEVSAVAASYEPEDIGPVIQPLYPQLFGGLEKVGVRPTGPALAYYESAPGEDGEAVVVHAAVPVAVGPDARYDFAVVDLPGITSAATIVHRGSMDSVGKSFQILAQWIEENGHRTEGYAREVYVDYCPENPSDSVTELQIPLVMAEPGQVTG